MKNFVQEGLTITVVAIVAMTSGVAYKVGDLSGVATTDAAIGEKCELITEGVFELAKVATDVIAQGEKLHLDSVTDNVTVTDLANFLFGIATEARVSGDLTVPVKIIQAASAAGAAS